MPLMGSTQIFLAGPPLVPCKMAPVSREEKVLRYKEKKKARKYAKKVCYMLQGRLMQRAAQGLRANSQANWMSSSNWIRCCLWMNIAADCFNITVPVKEGKGTDHFKNLAVSMLLRLWCFNSRRIPNFQNKPMIRIVKYKLTLIVLEFRLLYQQQHYSYESCEPRSSMC